MSEGAAPSVGAESSAAPTGEANVEQSGNQAGTRADGRAIAPIRESLPGVVEATEDDEKLARLTGESQRAARGQRDQQGRFVKSGVEKSAEIPLKPGEEPAPTKYKWAGEEWDSQEKAEQSFKTLRGQYKALDSRARERDAAAHSASAWKAEHDRVAAELQALKQGKAAPSNEATPEQSAPKAGESIDWALFAEIQKVAAERGDPGFANRWLAEQQEAVIQARIEKAINERLEKELAPVKEAEQIRYVENHTSNLFASMAEYVTDDGSPAFPELQNEEQAADVGRLWHSLGLPPEQALTPQGAMSAVLMYRGYAAARNSGKTHEAAVAAATQATPPTPSDASTVIEEGQPVFDNEATADPGTDPVAARLQTALRRSGAHLTVPGLGFSR